MESSQQGRVRHNEHSQDNAALADRMERMMTMMGDVMQEVQDLKTEVPKVEAVRDGLREK